MELKMAGASLVTKYGFNSGGSFGNLGPNSLV